MFKNNILLIICLFLGLIANYSSLHCQNIDLTTINNQVVNNPNSSNVSITWHTSEPVSDSNKITDPTDVPAGPVYYMAYFDSTNMCYSPSTGVPTLTNTCPNNSFDLTVLNSNATNNPGSSVSISWHTALPVSDSNKITDPTNVSVAQVYYISYYDSVNMCYSPGTPVLTTIQPCEADLSLKISVSNSLPKVGDNIIYTLTIRNDGPLDATGILVSNVIPNGLNYNPLASGTLIPTGTSYDEVSTPNIWNVGNLSVNQSLTLNLEVTINGAGILTNTAEITQSNPSDIDSTPNNGN